MSSVLYILIPIVFIIVVAVLAVGVIAYARGGKFNKSHSNKLMQARVLFQFIAIVLLLLLAVVGNSGG